MTKKKFAPDSRTEANQQPITPTSDGVYLRELDGWYERACRGYRLKCNRTGARYNQPARVDCGVEGDRYVLRNSNRELYRVRITADWF